MGTSDRFAWRAQLTPKLIICLREGYGRPRFLADLGAGVTVGIIALPLAMAFGIASIPSEVASDLAQRGLPSPPAMGLYTAVVAGFLISLLGGSRVQIGGPTGAFIVIVYGVAARHGYEGLATATLMAGGIIFVLGLARLGAAIKFIPYPVTTGFTTGIAVIIAASQLNDFLGLNLDRVPSEFLAKMEVIGVHLLGTDLPTLGTGLLALAIMIVLRRLAPRIPGAIVAVIVTSAVVAAFDLPVVTITDRYPGGIPRSLPTPHLPSLDFTLVRSLIPEATTIALLCAIESLLSAVVADGMIGARHRSDQELVAQGVANVGSALFFGIPATGAIARTVANVKSGGRTPVAGIIHAITLLAIMMALAPLAGAIPLTTLAAVLLVVAWNMSELDHFRWLLRAPRSDVMVLLSTFGLTVFIDLTVAVGVGMVLAALLFMKRMADVSNVSAITRELVDDPEDELARLKDPAATSHFQIPAGVEVYEIDGPFFFGVVDRLKDALSGIRRPPKYFILRMRRVSAIDATGLHALRELNAKLRRQGTRLLLSGVHAQPLLAFARSGMDVELGRENMFADFDSALAEARRGRTGESSSSKTDG